MNNADDTDIEPNETEETTAMTPDDPEDYGADQIKVLRGLDAVRGVGMWLDRPFAVSG